MFHPKQQTTTGRAAVGFCTRMLVSVMAVAALGACSQDVTVVRSAPPDYSSTGGEPRGENPTQEGRSTAGTGVGGNDCDPLPDQLACLLSGPFTQPVCGGQANAQIRFFDDNTGTVSNPDCTGSCDPASGLFTWTVSGSQIALDYDSYIICGEDYTPAAADAVSFHCGDGQLLLGDATWSGSPGPYDNGCAGSGREITAPPPEPKPTVCDDDRYDFGYPDCTAEIIGDGNCDSQCFCEAFDNDGGDCVCKPFCLGHWACGPDGCGGECGTCSEGLSCALAQHQCE